MRLALERYRDFVDAIVRRREGVLALWIREKGWPKLPVNDGLNAFLQSLTSEEKNILVRIAREARDSGIHDVLAVIQEGMDLHKLRIVVDDVTLPNSPYGTELFWDWTARANGAPWPHEPENHGEPEAGEP
jgi:hypothetical protein